LGIQDKSPDGDEQKLEPSKLKKYPIEIFIDQQFEETNKQLH
jgi:hypothetical protein